MGKLDLGNAADFARATLSDLSGILQALGRDPTEWDILEGSYNGVVFHVLETKVAWQGALPQISDSGGRRKVKYKFPYKDGQTTDDLGRKAETFNFEVLIFGSSYLQGLEALLRELNKPTPGDLVHPVRGNLRVVPDDWELTHSFDQRKAVAVKLSFSEHNFSVGEVSRAKDPTAKGALTKALETLSKIDQVITNVAGAIQFAQNLKTQVTTLLGRYKENFGSALKRSNATFNDGSNADVPTLLPVNEGGTAAGGAFPTVTSPNDPFAALPDSLLSQVAINALAIEQLTKEINKLRADVNEILALLGQNPLEFYGDILTMKQSAVDLQEVLEKGIASSQSRIIEYKVPYTMSLREATFLNGLPVDRVTELDLLNPDLLSTNFIEKGSFLRVPQS